MPPGATIRTHWCVIWTSSVRTYQIALTTGDQTYHLTKRPKNRNRSRADGISCNVLIFFFTPDALASISSTGFIGGERGRIQPCFASHSSGSSAFFRLGRKYIAAAK